MRASRDPPIRPILRTSGTSAAASATSSPNGDGGSGPLTTRSASRRSMLLDVPSTTYPGFTSLLTGAGQWKTGVRTTAQRSGAVPGWAGMDRTVLPTIVHAAREAGLTTAVVMGNQKLEKVLRLDDLDRVWPSGAVVPAGTEIDRHGYPTNAAVRPHLLEAAGDPAVDLLFAHLNETDTLGHDLGPSSPETFECAH